MRLPQVWHSTIAIHTGLRVCAPGVGCLRTAAVAQLMAQL
jgi:hypothetical protein